MNVRRYGWIPDLPDKRDLGFCASRAMDLPEHVDLSADCGPVFDQGSLGSCTANAIAGALSFNQRTQGARMLRPASRLFIYYNERRIEGTIEIDAGAMIRNGIKTCVREGACEESMWPYDIALFRALPRPECYAHAKLHQVVSYARVYQSVAQMRSCLASGYPFVFGFSVYDSMESGDFRATRVVPMPLRADRLEGGHAVLAVGYDHARRLFKVRNSWGVAWGDGGHYWMPYEYLEDEDLAADMWTIRSVEIPEEEVK